MSVIRRLILGLWTGLLVAQIGFFVPVLFQTLTEPGQAARVAGQGFVGISYVSLVAGVVVFLLRPSLLPLPLLLKPDRCS